MKRIRQILYATDFSATSRRALDTALVLARSQDAKLTIVHVIAPIVLVPEQYLDPVTMDQLQKQSRQWSTRQLTSLGTRAKKAGVKASVLLREGDAADQIVRACRSTKSDLIVMGTHGRRGLQRFLLGSVAERVVATAPCPVVHCERGMNGDSTTRRQVNARTSDACEKRHDECKRQGTSARSSST
jgi:nucleotide-binding universal stress UspA family protein